ncbi:MAG: DUF3877 family protein [Oscillospiraceae bacterium]
MTPDFEALEKNLIDVIKESHIKLGYTNNSIGIFYPPSSLGNMLKVPFEVSELKKTLSDFCEFENQRIGEVSVSYYPDDNRFGITVSAQAVGFIHENIPDPQFLKDFISNIHSCRSIEDITEIFKRYSDKVCCEHIESEEFDYLLYFADGIPDDYRYCIQFEMGHASYHRFTQSDFDELGIF